MAQARDTLYILEDEPPGERRRWYCHEHPQGFDQVDDAVVWALARARTAIIRTLEQVFYYAGEVPSDPSDADARPWPPGEGERAEIDAAYQRAVESVAKEEEAWLEYVYARDAWLEGVAPEFAGTEPEHRCFIDTPDGTTIELEEFAGGSLCCGRRLSSGPAAFGSAADVLTGTAGRPESDPWLVAVLAARQRELAWRDGRRQHLDVRIGSGELFHVTAATNRDSIQRHGLDWTQMSSGGIAGSRASELEAVFLCDSLEDAKFFTWMGTTTLDIWGVGVEGLVLENGPDGWWIVSEPIPAERLRLAVSDLVPEPPVPESSTEVSGGGYMRIVRRGDHDA